MKLAFSRLPMAWDEASVERGASGNNCNKSYVAASVCLTKRCTYVTRMPLFRRASTIWSSERGSPIVSDRRRRSAAPASLAIETRTSGRSGYLASIGGRPICSSIPVDKWAMVVQTKVVGRCRSAQTYQSWRCAGSSFCCETSVAEQRSTRLLSQQTLRGMEPRSVQRYLLQ